MMENACKILVIEDDVDIGNVIRLILEFKGHDVTVMENAADISAVIKEQNIGLVVMDMLLSGEDGTDVCIELRKDHSLIHIPVIMMSAHADAETKCLAAGADDFISKPFDLDNLLLKVGRFIAHKSL